MLQTYEGKLIDGRIVFPNDVLMPNEDGIRVIVTFDFQSTKAVTREERQLEALKTFITNNEKITNESITENELLDFDNNRIEFRKEMDL